MLWAWIMFCALDIHRRNINRAISDNMLPELGEYSLPKGFRRMFFINMLRVPIGMNTNDYNCKTHLFDM